ncbi:DsbC family protein [Ectothiorhodospiraceae bacterium WFHF3C12]|nr:DsbC family protein [Ectothiorhodospiraceae bacterium WFHF3C12]
MRKGIAVLLSSLLLALSVQVHADSEAAKDRIEKGLQAINPQIQVDAVAPTPIDGVYEVTIGSEIYYVSGDGRYMLQGELVDLKERRSLTEPRRASLRAKLVEEVPEDQMLIYSPEGEIQHRITVVTDIDCPYCRRFHRHMDEYNARGVEVRYLLMPRAGVQSESYDKAVSVWCSEDRLAAMTRAKQGADMEKRDCENPVKSHMALAERLGVRATPTIITGSGDVIRGYRGPDDLLQALEATQSQAAAR